MNPAPKAPDLSSYSGRFAARLKMLREKAGLTVEDAVAAVVTDGFKCSIRTYYAWEAGINSPPLDAFPSLARVVKAKSVRTLVPAD